jgi:hypothetical protein
VTVLELSVVTWTWSPLLFENVLPLIAAVIEPVPVPSSMMPSLPRPALVFE